MLNEIKANNPTASVDQQLAAHNGKRRWTPIKTKICILGIVTCSLILEALRWLICKIIELTNRMFGGHASDPYKLFQSTKPISPAEESWHLNLSLLKNIRDRTDDPVIKRKLNFLIHNYLAKSAPLFMSTTRRLFSETEYLSQVSPSTPFTYHRYGFLTNIKIGKQTNQHLALENESPFIPTDTTAFDQLLPLKYHVYGDTKSAEESIKTELGNHLQASPDSPLKKPLPRSFLLDLTATFQDRIRTKDNECGRAIKREKEQLLRVIDQIASDLASQHPNISQKELVHYLKQQITAICRIEPDHERGLLGGIKILPLIHSLDGDKVFQYHDSFTNFIAETGIFTGPIPTRRSLLDLVSDREDVTYSVTRGKTDGIYFSSPADFLAKNSFKEFEQIDAKGVDPFAVLAQSTAKMIRGLLQREMKQTTWRELQADPITNEIVQTALFRLQLHLATASFAQKGNDFNQFITEIELAHCQLAALLEFTSPFSYPDFGRTFKEKLTIVPEDLTVNAGLCKTGVNTFAGINAALLQETKSPVRTYGKGFYFEQAHFIGEDRTFASVIKDDTIERVDLFACQFNPGVEIDPDHTHYSVGKIADNIREIFAKKPKTEQMTVAVDCTIDYLNSEKVQNLLAQFKEEIQSGKLNFVLFRSGQKFDMFGLDSYYGAPVYIVNNGSDQWRPFNAILTDNVYQTDSLSLQWFCLANQYANKELDDYRRLVFTNTRSLLQHVPDRLKPLQGRATKQTRINSVDGELDTCFVDIKITGLFHKIRAYFYVALYYYRLVQEGVIPQSRGSIGFAHSNVNLISVNAVKGASTIRLCPGINPKENRVLQELFEEIAASN